MIRRFITGLGGAAVWPLGARAQQGNRVRRIGVLMGGRDENVARISAFTQVLADLGWTDGRSVRMDLRYAGGDSNRIRALAQDLVGLQPDIILTWGTVAAAPHFLARPKPCIRWAMPSARAVCGGAEPPPPRSLNGEPE